MDDESVPWAAAGSSATLYLTNVDPINLSIGYVLCPPTNLVPLTTSFTARIIVFDVSLPIIIGASVELFHHSHNVVYQFTSFLNRMWVILSHRSRYMLIKRVLKILASSESAPKTEQRLNTIMLFAFGVTSYRLDDLSNCAADGSYKMDFMSATALRVVTRSNTGTPHIKRLSIHAPAHAL